MSVALNHSWFGTCYRIAQCVFNIHIGHTIPTYWSRHFVTCEKRTKKMRTKINNKKFILFTLNAISRT